MRFFLLPAYKNLSNYQFIICNHLAETLNTLMNKTMSTVATVKNIPENIIKLYQRKKHGWFISGYKCGNCLKHFAKFGEPLRKHLETCNIVRHCVDDEEIVEDNIMPIREVRNNQGKTIGYQWGSSGKIYRNREDAEKQARAIYASGYKEKKEKK